MKRIIPFFLLLCFFTDVKASDDNTVTLITSGQGKTQDEAKQNALRNAIEQAFGAFISSHTEIVNDNLVKDEIISVSNGNIQKYEVISESLLPNNLGYSTTLKTIVSISKLTSFCESKGMKIEIQGSLFAFNVIQKELSVANEKKALEELIYLASKIAPKMFDYTITSSDPIKNEILNNNKEYQNLKPFSLPIKVTILINKNWEEFYRILDNALEALALLDSEQEDLKKMNIKYYSVDIFNNKKQFNGEFNFHSSPNYSSVSSQDFDKNMWKNLQLINNGENPFAYSSFYFNYPITAEGFDYQNYTVKTLSFRTNIKSFFEMLFKSIVTESLNFKIINQSDAEIKIDGFNALLLPISNEGWELNHQRTEKITYRYKDFKKRANMYARYTFEPVLNAKSIFIQKIKSGSEIGYSYSCPTFDLEEIKNLTKLEVKHIHIPIESNKSANNNERNNTTYIVKSGDTVGGIAQKYHVKVADLMKNNPDIQKGIKVGQTIYIPSTK